MLQRTPKLSSELDIYLVQVRATLIGTTVRYWLERDTEETSEQSTKDDILSGQIEGVERVVRFNPSENTCRDVSLDFAEDILANIVTRPNDGSGIPSHLISFLEDQLGCRTVAEANREMVSA